MKTIRGTKEQLELLNQNLNAYYKYPNISTLTETYSQIQIEYGTNEFCFMIMDEDVNFANEIVGLVIQDGNTIAIEKLTIPL